LLYFMKKSILYIFALLFMCNNAYAQIPTGSSKDSKLPIEVTGDTLEVLKPQQKAIFSGSVVAKQGDVAIKSDKMTIYYKEKDEKSADKQNGISKVETVGNVRLQTPKESAKGDNGLFDVEKNIITISGHVVLVSGENSVNGDKLVYNLTTEQSTLVSNSQVVGTKNGRVHGVFTPKGK
jgi:lipopolysaccharide export system protein LptA